MTQSVSDALGLTQLQANTVRAALAANWRTAIALVWTVDDVQGVCEENGWKPLSEARATKVLGYVLNGHDAMLGVTHDTIASAIVDLGYSVDVDA